MNKVKKYAEFDDVDKELYFYLGLLSTKFAVLEYNVLKLLGRHISEDFVLTNNLFERNSLAQNIEFLKKINIRKGFEVDAISNLIQKITNIKKKRNLFIHGLWGKPRSEENDWIITCQEPKMDYSEQHENGKRIRQTWKSTTDYEFRLSYLKKLTQDINDIIFAQNYLIEKIELYDFD